jgi:hypothetical protein
MIPEFQESDYENLVKYAKGKIHPSNFGQIDPRDIVNEILVKYLASDDDVLLHDIKKEIWSLCTNTVKQDRLNPQRSKVTTKVCVCCNEIVPINGFYLVFRKSNNQEEMLYQCMECQKKYNKEYTNKNKNNPEFKAKRKDRARKYYEKKKLTDKDWVAKQSKKIKDFGIKWRLENKEKVKEHNKKAVSKFVNKDRDAWNAYLRKRYAEKKLREQGNNVNSYGVRKRKCTNPVKIDEIVNQVPL